MSEQDEEPGEDAGGRLERLIAPYFREPTLWPVLLVLLVHAAVVLAVLLLAAVRARGLAALAAMALLLVLSADGVRRDLQRRRLGLVSRAVGVIWILAALAAWGAHRTGIY